jgi:copper transport protein
VHLSQRRRALRLLVLPLSLALLLLSAGSASAHAQLESSRPADGVRLSQAPTAVVLTFSEQVQPVLADTEVVDGSLHVVSTVAGAHGRDVTIPLQAGLPRGVYIAQYRVISADSHPVSGAISFGIGVTPSGDTTASVPGVHAPTVVGFTLGLARVLGWLALIVLLGLPPVLLVLWPAGLSRRPIRRLLWTAWTLTYLSLLATVFLRGPYDAAVGLGHVFDGGLLRQTLTSHAGSVLKAEAVLLAVALVPLRLLTPRTGSAPAVTTRTKVLGLVVGLALWATVAASGHSGAGTHWPLWTGLVTLHLTAMGIWLAGLGLLAVAAVRRSWWASWPDENQGLRRWSRLALGAVAAIALTGTLQSLRSLDAFGEITGTLYGRLLLVKVLLFGAMLGLAAAHQRRVRGAADAGPSRLVLPELALGVTVLAVTSLLTVTAPGRDTYSPPLHRAVLAQGLLVTVDIPHTRRGPQSVTAHFADPKGYPVAADEVDATYTEDRRGIGPLPLPMRLGLGGEFATGTANILTPGVWRLRLSVRTSDVDVEIADVIYRIR